MSDINEAQRRAVMIRLVGISKTFPTAATPAVEPLDLEIREGELVCLLGPSGCGKTTTLRMINRLVEPSTGQIWIDGKDVTGEDPDNLRRHIGYVIQQVGLMPHMTIEQNIGLVPQMLGWTKEKTTARVLELLDLVGLAPEEFRHRYPKQLSGGQQQRVGVARALAADPPVLLMDEPFGAIDPINRDRLQDELLKLQDQIRKTIVFVTHDVSEAIKMSDRVAIFSNESKIVQFAPPLEILTRPADDFVRSFVGKGSSVKRLELLTLDQLALSKGKESVSSQGHEIEVARHNTVSETLEKMLEAGAMSARTPEGDFFSVQEMLAAASTKDGSK